MTPAENTITGTTVRYWSVYDQTWISCDVRDVPDRELAAMPREEREAILLARKSAALDD